MSGMQPNQFLGIVKFFRDEEYLDKLIAGCMHCQTPETFRLHDSPGVSDRSESCTYAWRSARNEPGFQLNINGIDIPSDSVHSLTIQHRGRGDSWLHCWCSLRLPEGPEALEKLKADIAQLKQEFGGHYAYIEPRHVPVFMDRLRVSAGKPMWCGEVQYSDTSTDWDSSCKSTAYAYQREYRFGFGECGTHELEPFVFHHEGGFSDLIHKDADFKLESEDGEVWLDLRLL